MQRSEYSPYQKPQWDIDHRQAVLVAYSNVLNSFQMGEMSSASESQQGVTRMLSESKVTVSRFIYHLSLLDSLLDEDKDEAFKTEGKPLSMVEVLGNVHPSAIPNMIPGPIFAYWTRIDKLLRRNEMFSAQRILKGHI